MDTPETLAAALLRAAMAGSVEAAKVVSKGALNIKKEARASVHRTAPVQNAHAAETITYDTPQLIHGGIESEIGYDRREGKEAAIGNLLEFGGGGDHSPPHRDLGRALDAEEPRFELALGAAIEKLL